MQHVFVVNAVLLAVGAITGSAVITTRYLVEGRIAS